MTVVLGMDTKEQVGMDITVLLHLLLEVEDLHQQVVVEVEEHMLQLQIQTQHQKFLQQLQQRSQQQNQLLFSSQTLQQTVGMR